MKESKKGIAISLAETASFCSQMASILHAGISSLEGISIFMEDAGSTQEKELLSQIYDELLRTGYLYEGLAATHAFPDYMVKMCKLGEQTGHLDDIMQSLATHYEQEDAIRSSMRNVITYPLVMICMMIAVILIIITKVLPVFNQAFTQLGAQMNAASQLLLNFGGLLNRYSAVLIGIIAVIICSALLLSRSAYFQSVSVRLLSILPGGRTYRSQTSLYRFSDAMSLSLQSGFSIEQSLSMASELIDDADFLKKLEKCQNMLEDGTSFEQALTQTAVLTGLQARMVSIGSKTGTLESTFKKITEETTNALENTIARRISILEPTLVAILSIVTGVILLSVMIPLLGILSGM